MLDTVVFTDPKAIEFFTNETLLVTIDTDVDTPTRTQYRLSGYPTTVLVDTNGTDIDPAPGSKPPEAYL